MRATCWHVVAAASAVWLVGGGLAPRARAASRYYVGPATGAAARWNSAANWSGTLNGAGGAGVPGAADLAAVFHRDTTNRNVLLDASATVATLSIANTFAVNTLTQSANVTLTSTDEIVGTDFFGRGAHVQSAGTNNVTQELWLGFYPNSVGTYSLSGGTLNVGNLLIGNTGVGVFLQTGGRHNANFIAVGHERQGDDYIGLGTYNLSGGTLTARDAANVGYESHGTFAHSGGTFIVGAPGAPARLAVAGFKGGTGAYLLSAAAGPATLTIYGNEIIGDEAPGSFTQSGGTHALNGDLYVGDGAVGSFTLSGGTFNVAGNEFIGTFGDGSAFVQTGGRHTIGSTSLNRGLFLSRFNFPGGSSYTLDGPGASLTIYGGAFAGGDDLRAGGIATLTVAAGSLNITGPLKVWNTSRLNYTGGAINVNGPLALAGGGDAVLSAGGGKVLRTTALSIDAPGGSVLDLADNAMIVDYAPPPGSLIADVRAHLRSGAIVGATADPRKRIGYADNTVLGRTTFAGHDVDLTSLLLLYTWTGDANLDGTVNLQDFNRLASAFGASATAVWTQGDFNYDGHVTLQDFNLLAGNFGLGAAGPGVTPEDWATLAASVPEPLSLAALALAPLLGRPRRRHRHLPRSPI